MSRAGSGNSLEARARDEALEELCDRKEVLQIATAYVSFPSRFLSREGSTLLLRANMGQQTVRHTLERNPLRLRFPWALSFWAGETRLLAYEHTEAGRFLRVALPDRLYQDDPRRHPRVDRLGQTSGALGSSGLDLVRVRVESLSLGGAGIFCLDPLEGDGFQPGRRVDCELNLPNGPSLKTGARIVHGEGQYLGLEFSPALAGPEAEGLSEWLAPRLLEAQRRWEDRAELRAQAQRAAAPKASPEGVLLVGPDASLVEPLQALLGAELPVRHSLLGMAPLKAALEAPPRMLILDPGPLDSENRRRIRTLLDALEFLGPLVILDRQEDAVELRTFALELKAVHVAWNPAQGLFFRRLAQGLIRRHEPRKEASDAQ